MTSAMVTLLAFTAAASALVLSGALLATHRTRRFLSKWPAAFRCTLYLDTSGVRWWQRRKLRRAGWGVWLHDALVITGGLLRTKVSLVPVHFVEGSVEMTAARRKFGPDRAILRLSLRLDDGRDAVLTAPRSAESHMAGPYLAACVALRDLPGTDEPTRH